MFKIACVTIALLAPASAVIAADTQDTSTWVQFSSFTYAGEMAVVPGADEYLNPVIAGFYPDPSICRVGDDYYVVNSSFNFFPGIPIWHSRDLVNWTQIGNVLDRPSQFTMRGGAVQSGAYAPTIRQHNGTFYVICTLVGGIGNFYVTATDPRGPWSDPVRLPNVGGIDPDIFFDDDGKCYILSCDGPVGPPKYNGHRTIRIQEFDLNERRSVGEKTVIVDGGTDISKEPIWCEAPHIYKINGTYYLLCAEGGTGWAHTAVIFKSDSIRGPYVPWDKNPILAAADLPDNRPNPVACTGHADFVQTQNGQWYAVFLATQPYQGRFYNTGRQTFLLPVTWTDGWPVILPPRTPVPLTVKKPNLPVDKAAAVPSTGNIRFTDNFDSGDLAFRWIGLRVPTSKWYAISKTAKALCMEPRTDHFSGQGNPSFLAVRQQNDDFTCTVTLTAQPKTIDCVAGLVAFQNERSYYAINVKIESGRLTEISLEQPAAGSRSARRGGPRPEPNILATAKLPDDLASIELKIEGAGPRTRCFYRVGNGDFAQLGEDLQSSFLSTETAGGFQGVTLGMFARN
jgi:xylan 1,4-beta-xylosidase